MEQVYKKARGKINLILQILDKREDGYHNLKSIFQMIHFYDELWVSKTDTDTIEIEIANFELPLEQNIIYKAYQKLKEQYKIGGVKVKLIKHIPTQAGLGGGSSDCAAFLKAMNQLFCLNITQKELELLGAKLGADVPATLNKGTVLGEGIGEKIERVLTTAKYYLVIIKPEVSFSTKEMFQKLDEKPYIRQEIDFDIMLSALKTGDIKSLCANLYNSFEEIIEDNLELKIVKEMLQKNGAKGAALCGSGSCVFGIFDEKEEALTAYQIIKQEKEAYLCLPYGVKMEEKE